MKKTLLLVPLLILTAFSADAQSRRGGPRVGPKENETLTAAPAVVTLKGSFGQSTTQRLTLANGTDRTFEFELVAKDVEVRGGKRRFAAAGELPRSIAATAVFSAKSVSVPPGESRSVDVTVTLPPETTLRAVVALFHGTTKIVKGGASATPSLGTLMTFTLTDQISLAASPLTVKGQSSTTNASFDQELVNDGSEPAVAKGIAVILDPAGAIVGRSAFESKRLLPGEKAVVHAEYPGELRRGKYRLVGTFEYEGKSFSRTADFEVK